MIESCLVYLIKVSIGTGLMLTGYQLLFRTETNHTRNRIYLLSSMILPTILPLININILQADNSGIIHVSEVKSILVDVPVNINEGINLAVTKIGFLEVLTFLYLLGLVYRIIVLIVSWIKVRIIINKGKHFLRDGINITVVDDHIPPFSFFNQIVIPENYFIGPDSENILLHEIAHIKQKHFIDLLICEIFLAIYWFNPFSRILGKFIRENHEFMADSRVSARCKNIRTYQLSLLQVNEHGSYFKLAHNFNKRIIKKRIIMMNRPKTKPNAKLKYLLLLPFIGILVSITITCSKDPRMVLDQDSGILSDESTESILTAIQKSITYPSDVANANYEDEIYVVLKVRNNKVIETDTYTDEHDFTAPVISDVMVAAYRNYESKETGATKDELTNSLEMNCVRTMNELPELNIPESKRKTIEFAIKANFTLQRDYSQEEIFIIVEQMPKFEGGDINKFREWVQDRLTYPEDLKSKGVEGKVFVSFVVDPDGSVSNTAILRGLDPVLDKESLDVVNSSPKWEPGLQRGVPVRVRFSITIAFGNPK